MSRHKCVPDTISLKCTGNNEATTCQLSVSKQTVHVHSNALGLGSDKKIMGVFSFCKYNAAKGGVCTPIPLDWIKLSVESVKSHGERLITGNSELPCNLGGTIKINIEPPATSEPEEDSWFGSLSTKLKGFEDTLKAPLKSAAKAFGESDIGKTVIGTVGEMKSDVLETYNEYKDTALKTAARVGLENELQLVIDIEEGLVRQATRYATKAVDFVVESVDGAAGFVYDETQGSLKAWDTIIESDNPYETMREMASENFVRNSENFHQMLKAAKMSYDTFMEDPDGNLLKMYEDKKLATTDWMEAYANASTQEKQDMGVDAVVGGVKLVLDKKGQLKDGLDKLKDLSKSRNGNGDVIVNSNMAETNPNTNNKQNQDTNQKPDESTDQSADSDDTTRTAKEENRTDVGDPVDVVTGTVINDFIDFEIPGIIPIRWKRIWYSDSKYKGPLGYGHHHHYDMQLKQKSKNLILTLDDGRAAFFDMLTPGNPSSYNRKEKLTLTLQKDKNYQLFDHKKQRTYILEFRSGIYRLTSICNADGISIQFQYINSRLHRIVDTAGRIVKLHSDSKDRIIKITLHHKSKEKLLVTYNYNEAGDMITMTNPLGQSTRALYKNHLMVSKTDRNGQTYYWQYDGIGTGSKCVHTWGDGGVLNYTIEYGPEYNRVSNSLGHQSKYYHKDTIVTKIIDPLGGMISKEYDQDQNLIKFTDEEGYQTQYTYDGFGNLIETKFSDRAVTSYTFDNKGRLQLLTRPEGGVFVKSYKNDRLDCVIHPDGMMTTFEYNEKGLVSKVLDNQDNETSLFYDEDHNLIKMMLPNGAISTWEYDEWGQCITTVNPEKHKQHFHYDILGRVTQIQLPDSNEIQLKYNGYEQVIEAIDKHRTVKFEYTPVGNLKTREENGKKIFFQYNKEDQLIGVVNRKGESYSFSRDVKGNVIKEQGYDDITRHFNRNKAGKIYRIDRPNDRYTTYEYDQGGRVSRIEYHDGSWATYEYNKDGLLIEAITPNSHIKFTRDEAGRIISENQDGHIITNEYGELGVRTSIKSSLGANINFEHSVIGEGTKTKVNVGNSKPWDAQYTYNSLGMETERILSGGVKSSWFYDKAGRPLQHKIINSKRVQRSQTYNWDVNNKLRKITDNLTRGIINFTYDDFNNLAAAQYEDGSYDYKLPDEIGNLYRSKGKSDKEYGKSGKLLRSGTTTYRYDDEGNLTEKHTAKGVWFYTWEAKGMLNSIIKPDRTQIIMEYDALARRTAKIVKAFNPDGVQGLITRFLWDGNVPLHEWKYNLKDRPKTVINSFGNITNDKKEPVEDLITWIFDQGTFRPAAKIMNDETYSIITDYLGTPVEMYNSKGEKTWQAVYDIYGKVRTLALGSLGDCPFRYQGQYEDIETGLYYNRFRYYTPDDGVYISQDPIRLAGNNPNIYAYTHDSNAWVDAFGLDEKPEQHKSKEERNIDTLRSGGEVHVRSPKEAREILDSMPDIKPDIDEYPAWSHSGNVGDNPYGDLWKQQNGTYRGDLFPSNESLYDTGLIHDSGNIMHDTTPHYNIRFHNGEKGTIIISD